MKCLKVRKGISDFIEIECSPEQEDTLRAESLKWYLSYHKIFKCVAQSDGGVDACDTSVEQHITIEPDTMVLDEDYNVIGCFVINHLFQFSDDKTHYYSYKDDQGYVGGWGNVTETHFYHLMKK